MALSSVDIADDYPYFTKLLMDITRPLFEQFECNLKIVFI